MVIKIENDKMSQKAWWNRPLIGKKTLTEYLLKTNTRLKIPFETIYRHNQAIEKLDNLSITLKALFNEGFTAIDFLIYARIEEYLSQRNIEKQHYFSLGKNLFKVILDNLKNLERLKQLEEKLPTKVLQTFYQDAQYLIIHESHKLIFQAKLKKSYQLCKKRLSNDEDIYILKKYYRYLFNFSQVEYSLEFWSLLKKYELDNWELFKNIRSFVYDNQEDSIDKLKPFVLLAKMQEESLIEIGHKIIKIKKSSSNPLTIMAQVLQYTALDHKYQHLYPQFRLFLSYLRKWEQQYHYILSVREQYSDEEYLIPSSFKIKPHGFELYKNYHDYLGFREKRLQKLAINRQLSTTYSG